MDIHTQIRKSHTSNKLQYSNLKSLNTVGLKNRGDGKSLAGRGVYGARNEEAWKAHVRVRRK
jgi:hypothetical protein